ncbi:MAG: TonB-dependent hemoglobin/transferrin/lactoferrin family receptor [Pseudomonadota bacterium]
MIALTLLWATASEAQDTTGAGEPDNAGAATVEGLGDAVRMQPVTVTATTNPVTAFDYPGSVTVIDQDQIQRDIPSSPADILNKVPNVVFTGGPRRTGEIPVIRGFSGQDVIVLLDGARQNFISGHDGRFFVDPQLLETVEVVRGANSALYGTGGLGGVIEFRTRDASDFLAPGDSYGFSTFAGGQTGNNELSSGLSLFAAPIEGLDLLGSFVYRDSGDIELGGGGTLQSDDEIISGLVKGSYVTGPHRIELSWQRFHDSATEPNNGQGEGGVDLVDKDITAQTSQAIYNFNPASPWIDFQGQVYYVNSSVDELRLDAQGLGPTGETVTRKLNTIGLRLQNDSRFQPLDNSNVIVTYGIEYFRDKQDGASADGDRAGVPDARQNNFGAFVQAEISLSEPLGLPGEFLIIPGGRFDYFRSSSNLGNDQTDSRFSPKIGVSYSPLNWLLLYGSYAEAFSAPNINDLYLTGVHFEIPFGSNTIINRFVPNPDLKPQTARTFEAGLGLQFDDFLLDRDYFEFKGGYFRTKADNLIATQVNQPALFVDCNPFIPGDCDGTTTIENVSRARLQGTEIEALYDTPWARASVAYSIIDGKDLDTGEPVGGLQPDRVVFDLQAKIQGLDLYPGYRLTHAQEFDKTDDPDEFRDPYTLHDFYMIWAPSGDTPLTGLQVALGVDNVTNKEYSTVFTGANEMGRNFKALISYTLSF